MGITVTCPDSQVRHPEPFATLEEAERWAEWGHFCGTPHTFIDTAPSAAEGS